MNGPEPIRTSNHPITPADIDQDAFKVLRRLNQFGYHAFLVGGSVRDLLLGRQPKDFDVATSARPNEIRKLFRNCRLIGRRFRLAHICFAGGNIIETATFRAPPSQEADGPIRDDNEFGTPLTDAWRRDFTVNALFYDPVSDEVIDYCDGLADLEDRLLRTIGDPETRFQEDPVRMLRAVKFSARLNLNLETETRAGVLASRGELQKAAIPRLLEELVRMLWQGAAARSYELMSELGMLELLLPEIAAFLGRPGENPWQPLKGLLRALDRLHNGQQQHSTGVLLAALFWPLFQAVVAEVGDRQSPAQLRRLAEAIVAPAAVRLRIPRRELGVLIGALEGQVRFERARRRRNSRLAFARNPLFPAALDLFELRREAEHIDAETVAAFHVLAKESPEPLERPRRRRRRRQ